jgi:hypothetical protein
VSHSIAFKDFSFSCLARNYLQLIKGLAHWPRRASNKPFIFGSSKFELEVTKSLVSSFLFALSPCLVSLSLTRFPLATTYYPRSLADPTPTFVPSPVPLSSRPAHTWLLSDPPVFFGARSAVLRKFSERWSGTVGLCSAFDDIGFCPPSQGGTQGNHMLQASTQFSSVQGCLDSARDD